MILLRKILAVFLCLTVDNICGHEYTIGKNRWKVCINGTMLPSISANWKTNRIVTCCPFNDRIHEYSRESLAICSDYG